MNTQTRVQRLPRIILALLLMVGGFLMSSVPAHADDAVKSVVAIAQNDANIQGIVSISNDSLKKRSINILEYDAKAGTVSFDYATYNQLTNTDKTKFMQTALNATAQSGLATPRKAKLYNFIKQQDTKITKSIDTVKAEASGNQDQALMLARPWLAPVGVLLGAIALVVEALIYLSALLDMAYLTFPGVQSYRENGGKIRSKLFSSAAINAASEGAANGRNPMAYWAMKRLPVLMAAFFVTALLVSGGLLTVMGWVLKMFDAFMGMF